MDCEWKGSVLAIILVTKTTHNCRGIIDMLGSERKRHPHSTLEAIHDREAMVFGNLDKGFLIKLPSFNPRRQLAVPQAGVSLNGLVGGKDTRIGCIPRIRWPFFSARRTTVSAPVKLKTPRSGSVAN